MIKALLGSDAENAIQSPKRARLFLKPPRPLLIANKVAIYVTETNTKIIKPATYKKTIRDPIYGAH